MEKTYKFTLPQNKEVEKTNIRVENGDVIVDVEFKEKFEPKDGDFLHDKFCDITVIYKETHETGGIVTYAGINKDIIVCKTGRGFGITKEYRYATSEEKSAFLERLEKECHKRWNAEKKCLEDIYVPKFGDIVKVIIEGCDSFERNYMICIYPNKDFCEESSFFKPPFLTLNGRLILDSNGGSMHCSAIIPASESEKKELFDKLAEVGKLWNPGTKKLEDVRWKPEHGEVYYYVDYDSNVKRTKNMATCDEYRININNCFKTEEAALPYAEQIKGLFKNSKAE